MADLDSLPLWLNVNSVYQPQDFRQLVDAVFGEGVLTGFAVSQRAAGANMSVDVAAGKAIVQGDSIALQGKYLAFEDSVKNEVVTAAPGANSRYDIVVLRIYDATATGSGANKAAIEVIAGTAAASPVVPATPASALLLASIGPITTSTTSITTAMISNVAVTARAAFDLIDALAITTAKLANGAVTGAKIANNTIGTGNIADGQITSAKITDGTITTGDLADGAVTGAKIASNTIGTGSIVDGQITSAKLADGAVTTTKITDDAVTDAKAGAPTSATLTNGSTSVKYARYGSIVLVGGTVVNGSNVTLPEGFRPASTFNRMGSFAKASDITTDTPNIQISSAGTVSKSGGISGPSTFDTWFLV